MENLATYFAVEELSLAETGINLVVAIVLSFIVRYVYIHYSTTLANSRQLANILPMLAGVVFLVILVVKSSLALSLGLVGALSIVRFRTPIKEPEELVYLFLAIAIGLGAGAGQMIITTVVVLALLAIGVLRVKFKGANDQEFNFVVDCAQGANEDDLVATILAVLKDNSTSAYLSKVEAHKSNVTVVAKLTIEDAAKLEELIKAVRKELPDASCTFFDANPVW